MNNGILIQDIYSKVGFESNMPQSLSGPPNVVNMPYHFPPNYEWKNNTQQYIILIHDTTKQNNTTISIPYGVQTFSTDIIIDWGDGTTDKIIWTDAGNSRSTFHTYSGHGIYTVIVSGRLGRLGRAGPILLPSLTKCYSFGDLGLLSIAVAFGSCPNFIEAPASLPSGITSLASTFSSCTIFNDEKIKYWDTTNIIAMNSTFQSTSAFNQDLSMWNTSNVTNISNMFNFARNFNQDIGSWDVSKVTNMTSMFDTATSFNNGGSPSISGWNTINNTSLARTFALTPFNQPIGSWNTSNVTAMNQTFSNNSVFNQNIGSWDVSKVTNMLELFGTARAFNNGNSPSISGWNTINVTSMNNMFQNCNVFNQSLNNWNVRKVTSFSNMFNAATVFNGSLSGWAPGADTSGTTCSSMFSSASNFVGSGLNTWDVNKVTTMSNMFSAANAFQTNLSTWNLAGLNANTSLDNFMLNKTGANSYSTVNYDALLIGWNNNKLVGANGVANWRTDLRPNFGGAKYTSGGAAATARAALVTYGWTITDGGVA